MNQDSPSVARLMPVTARGQKARSRLLRAAEVVFGQKGYEGASIAEICRRSQSALGSFYVYFPDKKAAFVELVDSLGSRLRRELAEATEGVEGRMAIERAGLRAFFEFAASHRQLYRIVRQAEFVDPEAFHRYYRRMSTAYTAGLARAMDDGEIRRTDPEVLAFSLMGISDFLGMRWVLWGSDNAEERSLEIERVLDEAMHFVRAGMALNEGAAPRSAKAAADVAPISTRGAKATAKVSKGASTAKAAVVGKGSSRARR